MIAILEAQRAGLLGPKHWLPNIVAGVIVGVVALPLAMAFAIASGVKPEQGIYTAIIAGLIVSAIGGSRLQIAGPTGAFVVMLSGIIGEHGVAGCRSATLMAGVILVLMGVFRLGAIMRFIPAPVIVGFTAGIGVVIWVGQWHAFFGVPPARENTSTRSYSHLIRSLPDLHWPRRCFGAAGLRIVINAPRCAGAEARSRSADRMVVVTVLAGNRRLQRRGDDRQRVRRHPAGLPSFAAARHVVRRVIDLLGPAFTIAMLGCDRVAALRRGGGRDGRHAARFQPGAGGAGCRQRRLRRVRRDRRHRGDRAHGHQRPQRRHQPDRRHGARPVLRR